MTSLKEPVQNCRSTLWEAAVTMLPQERGSARWAPPHPHCLRVWLSLPSLQREGRRRAALPLAQEPLEALGLPEVLSAPCDQKDLHHHQRRQ